MDHRLHHDKIIDRGVSRYRPADYTERHHILPRCLGGKDNAANVVYLTGREHYVVHQLLALMHPNHLGLTYAAIKMAKQSTGARSYQWLRIRYSQHQTKSRLGKALPADQVLAMSLAHKDVPWSEIRRAAHKPQLGHVVSAETSKKISETMVGVRHSTARLQRMSDAKVGVPWTALQHASRAASSERKRAALGAAAMP